MSKLIAAQFARLWKNGVFWLGMLVMAVFGGYLPLSQWLENRGTLWEGADTMDSLVCVGTLLLGFVLATVVGLFLGTEYSDGTIRNKLIVGHTRTGVYLSHLIVCIAAGGLLCAAYLAPNLLIGVPLLGMTMPAAAVGRLVLCILALSAAYTALFTLVTMLSSSKAVAAVVCLLGTVLLLVGGYYLDARLSAPKTLEYAIVTADGNMTAKTRPNPSYMEDGARREMYQFFVDCLPGGQTMQLVMHEGAVPAGRLSLYSGMVVLVSTGAGLLAFRRKNIN